MKKKIISILIIMCMMSVIAEGVCANAAQWRVHDDDSLVYDTVESMLFLEEFDENDISEIGFNRVGTSENGAQFSLRNGNMEIAKSGTTGSAYIQQKTFIKLSTQTCIGFRFNLDSPAKSKFAVILRDKQSSAATGVFRLYTLDKGVAAYMPDSAQKVTERVSEGYQNVIIRIDQSNGTVEFYCNGDKKGEFDYTSLYSAFDMNNAALRFTLNSYDSASHKVHIDNVIICEDDITNIKKEKASFYDITEDVTFLESFDESSLDETDFLQSGDASDGVGFALDNGEITITKSGKTSMALIQQNKFIPLADEVCIGFRFHLYEPAKSKFAVILRDKQTDSTKGVFRLYTLDRGTAQYMPDSPQQVTEPVSEGYVNIIIKLDRSSGIAEFYCNGDKKCELDYESLYSEFDMDNVALRFTLTSYVTDMQRVDIDDVIICGQDLTQESVAVFTDVSQDGLDAYAVHGGETEIDAYVYSRLPFSGMFVCAAVYDSDGRFVSVQPEIFDADEGALNHLSFNVTVPEDGTLRMFAFSRELTPFCKSLAFSGKCDDEMLLYLQEQFETYSSNGSARPRIAVSQDEFDRMRSLYTSDNDLKRWADVRIGKADDIADADFGDQASDYFIGASNVSDVTSNIIDYVSTLAFAYQMTADNKYAEAVWRILYRAGASSGVFTDWKSNNFLSLAAFATAYAIGYDWCYDYFSEEQKACIENSILQYALVPAQDAYKADEELWLRASHNRNVVGNSGIAIAAFAIADKYPSCWSLIAEAVSNITYAVREYAPEGAWLEGTSYSVYLLQYFVLLEQTMLSNLGIDLGMSEYDGLDKAAEFLIATTGPCGANNFHDSSVALTNSYSYPVAWLGRYYNNSAVMNARLKLMNQKIPTIFGILYYNENATAQITLPLNSYFEGVENVNMRSAWNDSNAAWLSFHGGAVEGSHTHVDGGAFVFDLNGVRWACDLPNEPYSSAGYASFDERKYTYYRARAEGHNTIVIDPDNSAGQLLDAVMPVTRYDLDTNDPFAVLDMSAGYADKAQSAVRGYRMLTAERSAIIRDEITGLTADSEIYWFMHTQADAEVIGNNTVRLTKDGKTLILEYVTDAVNSEISIKAAEPLDTSPLPYGGTQADNGAYKKISIKLSGSEALSLTVKLREEGATPLANYEVINNWN